MSSDKPICMAPDCPEGGCICGRAEVEPQALAAAWGAWHSRHGGKLGPGPAFSEAIAAYLTVSPAHSAGILEGLRIAGRKDEMDAEQISTCRNCDEPLPDEPIDCGEAYGRPLLFCCEDCREEWFDAWGDDWE